MQIFFSVHFLSLDLVDAFNRSLGASVVVFFCARASPCGPEGSAVCILLNIVRNCKVVVKVSLEVAR